MVFDGIQAILEAEEKAERRIIETENKINLMIEEAKANAIQIIDEETEYLRMAHQTDMEKTKQKMARAIEIEREKLDAKCRAIELEALANLEKAVQLILERIVT